MARKTRKGFSDYCTHKAPTSHCMTKALSFKTLKEQQRFPLARHSHQAYIARLGGGGEGHKKEKLSIRSEEQPS